MNNSNRMAPKTLLIGWDAADWKMIHPLLDAGQMPNLNRLVEQGMIGNIATLQPCLSPILWTSIATGKTADKHGICGFVEPNSDGNGLRLSASTSRTTKAIWNILSQSGVRSVVVGWYATHPAEPIHGLCVSNRFAEDPPRDPREPWPMPPGSVHPPELAATIAELRMHPAELDFTELAAFIPQVGTIDLSSDPRPYVLARSLAHSASIHAVATGAMQAEPWDFFAVYYDALDVAGHMFMPYHPPRLAQVSEGDFELYQGVMNALYRFHDQMLGRLLELAGEETNVVLVSDHGFHSDHLRPHSWDPSASQESQAAAWHRHFGMLAISGPNIIQDQRIHGANLLDVTPTILAMFGLPVGEDMDGKVLTEVFDSLPAVTETIASWDDRQGEAGMHPAEMRQDPYSSAAAIQQLVDLGYLPAATTDAQQAIQIARAESQFNLAVVHLTHGRPSKARLLLEPLREEFPQEPRYAERLAKAYLDLGLYSQAQETMETLEARGNHSIDGELILAAALANQGDGDAALSRLEKTARNHPPSANLQYLIGSVLVSLQRWPDAQAAFARGVALDPDHAQCLNGLAQALLNLGEYERAAENAMQAIGLLYFYPQAHFHLGAALAELGEVTRAIRSMEIAVTHSPQYYEAHRRLAELYERDNNPLLALKHHRLADGLVAFD